MSIQEFSKALASGNADEELTKLQKLPPDVALNVDDQAMWPQWLSNRKN